MLNYTLPFGLTLTEVIILSALVVMLIAGIILFSYNYRKQLKVSLLFDHECNTYSKYGFEYYLKRKKDKFDNPTLIVVHIKNLGYLYTHYPKKYTMMVQIADCVLGGLDKRETIGRFEFDKFVVLRNGLNDDEVKGYIIEVKKRFEELEFENYGHYEFDLDFGVYPHPPFEDISLDDELTIRIPEYSQTCQFGHIYYFDNFVTEKFNLNKEIDETKQEALLNHQILPYYQAIFSLEDGLCKGFEVLMRWNGPRGLYNTDYVINEFNKSGFIRNLDKEMMRYACQEFLSIKTQNPGLELHVNISKQFLESKEFEEFVASTIIPMGYTYQDIVFEVNPLEAQIDSNKVRMLSAQGYRFAVDCFGNNSYQLKDIDPTVYDYVKIDRSIVTKVQSDPTQKLMLINLIKILSFLNIKIVCVGIESQESMDVMALGNNKVYVQGNFMMIPSPIAGCGQALSYICRHDYPDVNVAKETIEDGANAKDKDKDNDNPSLIINNTNSSDMDKIRQDMLEMQMRQQEQMQKMYEQMQQKSQNNDNYEIERLKLEIEALKNSKNNQIPTPQQTQTNNDEVERLRKEIERMKEEHREKMHQADLQRMQDEIDRLRNERNQPIYQYQQQPQPTYQQPTSNIDVNELIRRLQESQDERLNNVMEQNRKDKESLEERLEAERKQREELEALIAGMNSKEAEVIPDEETIQKEQEEANKNLNLDVKDLSKDDKDEDDDDDDDDDEKEEKLSKPVMTREEVEAIIKDYQEKYKDDWAQKAQEDLKGGFAQVVNDMKWYQKIKPKNFSEKMRDASDEVKQLYNICKNEFMKYENVNCKVTNSFDQFYVGKKLVGKMNITKTKVRVYIALEPNDYSYTQFPHKDVSIKKAHKKTPFLMKIKSQLSVKRLKPLIADLMSENNTTEMGFYDPQDYANTFKYYKKTGQDENADEKSDDVTETAPKAKSKPVEAKKEDTNPDETKEA
jgi:EAL domain-containing protein (putative c-di-GMP-specific phosphodiesterase class I)